jgi:hypothetical protein
VQVYPLSVVDSIYLLFLGRQASSQHVLVSGLPNYSALLAPHVPSCLQECIASNTFTTVALANTATTVNTISTDNMNESIPASCNTSK